MNTNDLVVAYIKAHSNGNYPLASKHAATLRALDGDSIHKLRLDWISWANRYRGKIAQEQTRKYRDNAGIMVWTAYVSAYEGLLREVTIAA